MVLIFMNNVYCIKCFLIWNLIDYLLLSLVNVIASKFFFSFLWYFFYHFDGRFLRIQDLRRWVFEPKTSHLGGNRQCYSDFIVLLISTLYCIHELVLCDQNLCPHVLMTMTLSNSYNAIISIMIEKSVLSLIYVII